MYNTFAKRAKKIFVRLQKIVNCKNSKIVGTRAPLAIELNATRSKKRYIIVIVM